jgi:hypothetical protein
VGVLFGEEEQRPLHAAADIVVVAQDKLREDRVDCFSTARMVSTSDFRNCRVALPRGDVRQELALARIGLA